MRAMVLAAVSFLVILSYLSMMTYWGTFIPSDDEMVNTLDTSPFSEKAMPDNITMAPFPPEKQRKRIALLFFGAIRSSDLALVPIHNNIIQPLQEEDYEIDIFLHSYVSQNPSLLSKFAADLNATVFLFSNLTEFDLQFKSNDIFQQLKLQFTSNNNSFSPGTVDNIYRARNSRKQVWDLFAEYSATTGKYFHAAAILRIDVLYLQKLPIASMRFTKNVIYVPSDHANNGVNDRVAFGHVDSIRAYGNMIDPMVPCGNWWNEFRSADASHYYWNPELYLKRHLTHQSGLEVKIFNLFTARLRLGNKLFNFDRSSATSVCRGKSTFECRVVRNAKWV